MLFTRATTRFCNRPRDRTQTYYNAMKKFSLHYCMFVFCLLVDLVRLSVLVQVIDRKDFVSKLAYNGDVSVGE